MDKYFKEDCDYTLFGSRDVFAYTDERKDKEIVQHCGVKGISVVRTIERYGQLEW
ncbi:hypothetical protein FACS1894105_08510 [Clostridia bacterium]|nr:hypothetical protein FACS1894105_08510 [Clostridia bacterium]